MFGELPQPGKVAAAPEYSEAKRTWVYQILDQNGALIADENSNVNFEQHRLDYAGSG
jgi:hypothetical protein